MKRGADGYYRHEWRADGARYTVRCKTERGLWEKVANKKMLISGGLIAANKNTPVEKWFTDYITTYKRATVTPRTFEQLQGYIKNYISPTIGNRRIQDVTASELQQVLNMCAGQSTSQALKLRNLICGAFRQARIERVLAFDPSAGIRIPATKSGTHRAITGAERAYILDVCKTHRAGLWVMFMLYTGARPDETRKALWKDIDFRKRVIILHSSKTEYGDRRVPLPPEFCNTLFAQRAAGYIFTQPTTGKPHTKTSMRQMWETFKRALDIAMGARTFRGAIIPETSVVAADLTPYCLRHTYATDLQTAGVPINVAREFLGHKNISMTAKIYTHLSDYSFAAAAEKIGALQSGTCGGT